MSKKYYKRKKSDAIGCKSVQDAIGIFFKRHKGREKLHIVNLWECWPMVMGDDLKDMAMPLGAKDRMLFVGAEDNMVMHELQFFAQEILDRANTFMDEDYFTKVRFELLQNRIPLYPRKRPAQFNPAHERPRPDNLGSLLNFFEPESKIGKAYKAYVESFDS